MSIEPTLRVRDYPLCHALDLRTAATDGLHASDDPLVLAATQRQWNALIRRADLPWPALKRMNDPAQVPAELTPV